MFREKSHLTFSAGTLKMAPHQEIDPLRITRANVAGVPSDI